MVKLNVSESKHVQFSETLNTVPIGIGADSVAGLEEELQEYCDVLLGRIEAPINSPYLALAEVATAYYARGLEIDMLIHNGERDGHITKGSDLYRFRTGSLRSFIEMAKVQSSLGSRRLTQERLLAEMRGDAGM